MALGIGDVVDVSAEKPASGGRMIARHEGEVVLVAGAIPGERVSARITRAERKVAFADTTAILEASSDRRTPAGDPACGGCVYAHIGYARQVQLKAQIIEDAFVRIGRVPLQQPIAVRPSEEDGYRMRARFHVKNHRAGFYREGSHETCDPRQTRQLSAGAADAADAVVAAFEGMGIAVASLELSENIRATHRAVHVNTGTSQDLARALDQAVLDARLTGATLRTSHGDTAASGDPIVTDTLPALTDGRAASGALRRHPEAFFQGNRYIIPALVNRVIDTVQEGPVLDLYAGVGLFSVALASVERDQIMAVEGDPVSALDLERNAAPFGERLRVTRSSVESFVLRGKARSYKTLIVDPPRTGMSKEAAELMAASGAARIVYVSCDPPTMARDARRLLDAGFRLESLEGFDLFPNTPHVEAIGVFTR